MTAKQTERPEIMIEHPVLDRLRRIFSLKRRDGGRFLFEDAARQNSAEITHYHLLALAEEIKRVAAAKSDDEPAEYAFFWMPPKQGYENCPAKPEGVLQWSLAARVRPGTPLDIPYCPWCGKKWEEHG